MQPYYQEKNITLHNGDVFIELKKMLPESIDMVCTSPPYWALRDYGIEGQLGLEPTFQEYITKLCDIFDEVKRVLKPTGTCWVNIGDTYCSHQGDPYKVGGFSGKQIHHNEAYGQSVVLKNKHRQLNNIPDKCLCMIPFRFAIEMVNRGWILRNTIIWHKRNCMPSSVKDRFTVDFEYVFFLTKSRKYWFEQQYESYTRLWDESNGGNMADIGHKKGGKIETKNTHPKGYPLPNPQGRNRRCVWTINTKPFEGAHFAVFPEALVEPMIKAGCPEFVCKKCGKAREKIYKKGELVSSCDYLPMARKKQIGLNTFHEKDPYGALPKREIKEIGYTNCNCNADFEGGVVLDPFCGSGTTGVVAKKLNRQFIGIDLNPKYCDIAVNRIKNTQELMFNA